MVTWNDYIKTQLEASKNVDKAMILSLRDGALWGASENFCPRYYEGEVTLEDGSDAKQMINEQENLVKLMSTGQKGPQGLRLNGVKYVVTRTVPDPLTIYAKGGGGGCCLTKTGHTILAATWLQEKGHTGPACNMAVEKLGEYLREKQF